MKTTLLSLLFLSCTFFTYSQNVSYGINIGLNYNNFQLEQDLSLSNQIEKLSSEGHAGFHIGIHSLINVASRVKLSPQFLLTFSENRLNIVYSGDQPGSVLLENVFIKVPIDIQLELLKGKNALYLIGGVEYATNIADEDDPGPILDLKKSFWSARLGMGFRIELSKFSISPELTFAKSFSNIEEENTLALNQVLTNLNDTNLSLSIKFQGLLDRD